MTGYEIKKRLDTRLRLFWNASYGSIYPTLNELEKDGLVKKEELEEKGRDKIRYTITEDGRDVLKEWLKKPAVKDELRYETLLKPESVKLSCFFTGTAQNQCYSLLYTEF